MFNSRANHPRSKWSGERHDASRRVASRCFARQNTEASRRCDAPDVTEYASTHFSIRRYILSYAFFSFSSFISSLLNAFILSSSSSNFATSFHSFSFSLSIFIKIHRAEYQNWCNCSLTIRELLKKFIGNFKKLLKTIFNIL